MTLEMSAGKIYLTGWSETVAVGFRADGVGGSDDFALERRDPGGAMVWDQQYDLGGSMDRLYGGVLHYDFLYVVGETAVAGADSDLAILQVDHVTGVVLGETLWGGSADDIATSVATNGSELIVVGETVSVGAGGRDALVLCFTTN